MHITPEVAPPAMLTGIHDAVLIYNPAAGRLRLERLQEAQRILREARIEAELWGTTGPGTATELARRAVSEKRQLVIGAGGDGTVNEIVNGLATSQVPLAVLPAGTANVLGKELELPWSMPDAARLIPTSNLRRIALGAASRPGTANAPRYFIALAGAGPDGMLVHATSLALKARIGILAYWLEGFRQTFVYPFPAFRVIADGVESLATTLVIGRTKHYSTPVKITTEASLFEDKFEVMVSVTRSRLRNLSGIPALFVNRHRSLKHIRFWKCASLRVEPLADTTVYAQVDGEDIGTLPVEFRIVPDALTLVVPEGLPLR